MKESTLSFFYLFSLAFKIEEIKFQFFIKKFTDLKLGLAFAHEWELPLNLTTSMEEVKKKVNLKI